MADEQLLDRIDRMARERGLSADDVVERALDALETAEAPAVTEQPAQPTDLPRVSGTVKWWSDAKGFGFITPDSGPRDLFVHWSQVSRKDIRGLREGERVSFIIENSGKGPVARDVQVMVREVAPPGGADVGV